MKRLENKWALVTGSSRGIGRQIALGLAREGCNVIVHGRTLEHTAETVALLKETGVQVDAVAADLGSVAEVNQMIQYILNKHGYVDILYNNAAISSPTKPIWEHPLEHWQHLFQVNLFTMILLCNAFGPIMKQRGYGRIINLSSGIKDQPQYAPYSVSKAAVDKYTKDLAFELQGSGVLANFLDPGWIQTGLGGPSAPNAVESVLPGALVPALFENDGPNGQGFNAQEYRER